LSVTLNVGYWQDLCRVHASLKIGIVSHFFLTYATVCLFSQSSTAWWYCWLLKL